MGGYQWHSSTMVIPKGKAFLCGYRWLQVKCTRCSLWCFPGGLVLGPVLSNLQAPTWPPYTQIWYQFPCVCWQCSDQNTVKLQNCLYNIQKWIPQMTTVLQRMNQETLCYILCNNVILTSYLRNTAWRNCPGVNAATYLIRKLDFYCVPNIYRCIYRCLFSSLPDEDPLQFK